MHPFAQCLMEAEQSAVCFLPSAGLGSLSRLPPEIRHQIWEDVLCSYDSVTNSDNAFDRESGITATMRLNRDVSEEISSIVYQSLEFTISPSWDEWGLSYVKVHSTDRGGWSTRISHSYFASCGYSAATRTVLEHFAKTPYQRFKTIWVDIKPPSPEEPGETVVVWSHLVWLLGLLSEHMTDMSTVQMKFLTTEIGDWNHKNRASWSANSFGGNYDNPAYFCPCLHILLNSSFELLLIPICRHNILSNIHFPREDGVIGMTPSKAFQQQRPWWLEFVDQRVEAEESMYLDMLLDDMKGSAAAKLRVERFSTWSDEYFWRIRQTVTGFDPLTSPPTATNDWHLCDDAPRSLNFDHQFVYEERKAPIDLNFSFRYCGLDLLSRRLFYLQSCNPLNPEKSFWTVHWLRGKFDDAEQALEYMQDIWYDSDDDSEIDSDDDSDNDSDDNDDNDSQADTSESQCSTQDLDIAKIPEPSVDATTLKNCLRARCEPELSLARWCLRKNEIGWDVQRWWDRYRCSDPDFYPDRKYGGIEPFRRARELHWNVGAYPQSRYATKKRLVGKYFEEDNESDFGRT